MKWARGNRSGRIRQPPIVERMVVAESALDLISSFVGSVGDTITEREALSAIASIIETSNRARQRPEKATRGNT